MKKWVCSKRYWFQYKKLINWGKELSHLAQRTECTSVLSDKNASNLYPKGNEGRELRPNWINKYPKEIIRNNHIERKNKRWISKELIVCWDKVRTARSQAELNIEYDIKTNSKRFCSYTNKKRTRKEEMGSLGVMLCQYARLGRTPRLKDYFTSAFRNKFRVRSNDRKS